MALIVDFLLLAASGAACFYCWVLSKRLKALTSTKDGIHTGIAALSQSAEEMQNAMSQTKEVANTSASHLETLLGESEKKIPELRDLLRQISDISEHAVSETHTATQNLVETLSPHIQEARDSAKLLLSSLEEASRDIASKPDENETPKEAQDGAEDDKQDDEDEIEYISVDDEKSTPEEKGEAA